ncbi:MAG: VOC family protein [Balneolaceae bacterium]
MMNPSYYNTVMPYLILKNVEAFIEFTKTVFDAEEKMKHPDENGRVVHAEITIGDSAIMTGESNDQYSTQNAGLYINVNSADETYQKALDAGAESVMGLSDKEYGRSCGVKDPFGNTWWITSQES